MEAAAPIANTKQLSWKIAYFAPRSGTRESRTKTSLFSFGQIDRAQSLTAAACSEMNHELGAAAKNRARRNGMLIITKNAPYLRRSLPVSIKPMEAVCWFVFAPVVATNILL
jgi:hypothetical protein